MLRIIALLLTVFLVTPAQACGPDGDCIVGDRIYRIALPDSPPSDQKMPAIIFAHGYKGTAEGVMRNGSLRRLASDLGAALIAVKSAGQGWNIPNNPRDPESDGTAEMAYFDAVLQDALSRFAIDPDQIVVSGFSAGGMMVWNLACARPSKFAGFVAVSGTFWKEPPATCSDPAASVLHIHGEKDRTVPLAGRTIGQTRQGEVSESLEMYAEFGGFGDAFLYQKDDLRCQDRQNPAGALLTFCLFDGGHSFRTEHLRFAWDKLTEYGRLAKLH